MTKQPAWYGGVSPQNPALQTPMMKQFISLKSTVPDALLMYRMGDFYELFLEDARIAADTLELTLTSRNKKHPEPVPMAGIPHHALDGYLRRLANAGFKVAIAEQEEDPINKKMMNRVLRRVVTPGVPWDTDSLNANESCWLCAISKRKAYGIAFLDVSTGEFKATEFPNAMAALAEAKRLTATELLVDLRLLNDPDVRHAVDDFPHTLKEASYFDPKYAERALKRTLNVGDLTAFGFSGSRAAIGAAGALLSYARDTALIDLTHVREIQRYSIAGHMALDESTFRNLEILQPLHGTDKSSTLLALMDKTKTAMGGRLLRSWLRAPLLNKNDINQRLDSISILQDNSIREPMREGLRSIADLERLSTKLGQGKINPREMAALASSVRRAPEVFQAVESHPLLAWVLPSSYPLDLADDIDRHLVEDPPVTISDGGMIRSGVSTELDEYTMLATQGRQAVAAMEEAERRRTGITSLKIKHNRVFGYFLEVTAANIERVPSDWIRKQTLANAERYITPELKEFEEKILAASEKKRSLEYEIFTQLRQRLGHFLADLQLLAKSVAKLDVIACMAELAVANRYVRPEMTGDLRLNIIGGRHPVIENMDMDEAFVPNDMHFSEKERMMILTGPNMAGKSTVMRQTALICLMAQVGSFVPADSAQIGICDQIFVRVGASDDLSRGRSTFMVEMGETALILNKATERSLLLLDEIGRGTSTYDGLSIAWSVAEAVHDNVKARTIFATHYHEMTTLAEKKPHMSNAHVAIAERGGRIIFLRTLRPGAVGKSYGIQCAKLAGLPKSVIKRAKEILSDLESQTRLTDQVDQLTFFQRPQQIESPEPSVSLAESLLTEIDPDDMTPREAMDFLYKLKKSTQA